MLLTAIVCRVTTYFLKDLIAGRKKYIKAKDARVCFVPQYEDLTIELILQEARKDPRMGQYLPDDRDHHMLPRAYLCNLAYSVVGRPFLDWVEKQVENRHEVMRAERNLVVDVDPEIAAIFSKSAMVSRKCPCPS